MKIWERSFWKDLSWSLIGAFIGSLVSVSLTLWYYDPREAVRASIEQARSDNRALALEEIDLLAQQIVSCDANVGATLAVSGAHAAPTGPDVRPLDEDKLSTVDDVAEFHNKALYALDDHDYARAREEIENAQAEHRNSLCYRDPVWEQQVQAITLCDAGEQYGDPHGVLRGWTYVVYTSDAEACGSGDDSAEELLLCNAIVGEDGFLLTSDENELTSRRIQQACGYLDRP